MLTRSQAERIYDEVLVPICGAPSTGLMRIDFVLQQVRGCEEFRFMGALGFGGKFWNDDVREEWRVTYYVESCTPERDAIVERANAVLAVLREEMVGV